MGWTRHLKLLLGTFIGANLALYLFVLAMNPFGNLPNTVLSKHLMMDTNQRYQYPSVVRSGRYDSAIIGTSTSRLLDPKPFAEALGGRFANIAMDSGTAWEQSELIGLFLRHQPKPHALVVGLDWAWCAENADRERITFRGFPEWMYDETKWNDLAYMYNTRALEIAGRRLVAVATGRAPRLPDNGWEIFTPPEGSYDLTKALGHIYSGGPRRPPAALVPPVQMSDVDRKLIVLPALPWLEGLLAGGKWQRTVLLFPPLHVIILPHPGSRTEIVEQECRRRAAALGARYGAHVVDFQFRSPITMKDENFWDPRHYRVPIAEQVARDTIEAIRTGRDGPDGTWRVLHWAK